MIKIKLQMFGGNGASSLSSANEGFTGSIVSDTFHAYEIRIDENGKIRTETFYGTEWQLREKMLNWIENKLGMTPEKYYRQNKYSYMPMRSKNDQDVSANAKDLFNKNNDSETAKHALESYYRSKKDFLIRYKKWLGKKINGG